MREPWRTLVAKTAARRKAMRQAVLAAARALSGVVIPKK
jgi:hypothetical protein